MASDIVRFRGMDGTEREGMLDARRSRVVTIEEVVVDGGGFWDTPTFETWSNIGSSGPLYVQENMVDPQLVGVGKGWKANIDVDEALGEVDEMDDTSFSVVALARRAACDPSMKKEATKSTA